MAAYTCQRSLASCFRRKAVTSVLLPSTVRSPSNIRSPRHVLPAVRFYSSGSGKLSHGKQITPKPNPLSWQAKYKKLRLATPLDQKEKEIVGDTSKMSNVQWLRKHKQEELVTMACFHQIFPDVIKDPVVADVNLVVKYLNSEDPSDYVLVEQGNWIQAGLLAEAPHVTFEPVHHRGGKNHFWSLLMVDADYPARFQPTERSINHWMVVNIPGDKGVEEGREIVPYTRPLPNLKTEGHRYAFLLFRQEGGELEADTLPDSDRRNLDLDKIILHNNLSLKGYSFFQSEWDLSVTEYYKERGLKEPVLETEKEAYMRLKDTDKTQARNEQTELRNLGVLEWS